MTEQPDAAPEEVPRKRPAFEPPARLLQRPHADPDMRRPISISAGVGLIVLRVLAGIVVLVGIAAGWDSLLADPDFVLIGFDPSSAASDVALATVIGIGAAVLAVDLLLAVFVYRGRNWARILVMLIAVLSISTAFTAWWAQGQSIEQQGTFLSVAVDILLLLALSSRTAAAYARRDERP